VKKLYRITINIIHNLLEDQGYRVAAEASFYLIFSIFPLLFIIFVLLGSIGNPLISSNWGETFLRMISTSVPDTTLEFVIPQFRSMLKQYREREIILAVILFLWPASNVFYAYMDAAGIAYRQPDQRNYFKSRLIAFILLFASGIVLFFTTVVLGIIPVLLEWLERVSPFSRSFTVLQMFRYLGSFVLLTPSIAMIYRWGPDFDTLENVRIWPGAIFATVLWVLFSILFGFYIQYFDSYQALYGVLGGAMLLLLWMYLISLAVILGAEFNYTLQQMKRENGSAND